MTSIFLQRIKIATWILLALNIMGSLFVVLAGVGWVVVPFSLFFICAFCIMPLFLIAFFTLLLVRTADSRPAIALFGVIALLFTVGYGLTPGFPFHHVLVDDVTILYVVGALLITLGTIGLFYALIEFGLLRLLGLFPLGAIARVTYYEALLQPFTIIVLAVGIVAIGVMARVSFFTYDEDFKMYRDIALSFVFLFSLPLMVFASTKVIDEEIENRTMLTLMSKPVSRAQVVLGKYLGVLVLVLVAVFTLGLMSAACCYLRFYDDKLLDYRVTNSTASYAYLDLENYKAFLAILPSLVLTFFQVAALAAVSVAISTRFGLAANITTIVVIYIAANLAQYMSTTADLPVVLRGIVTIGKFLLPGLTMLDLNQRLVFGNYVLGKSDWARDLPEYSKIWQYVGLASIYTTFYIGAALSFGIALFRSRELS